VEGGAHAGRRARRARIHQDALARHSAQAMPGARRFAADGRARRCAAVARAPARAARRASAHPRALPRGGQAPEIFIAATALGVQIHEDPEMAWLPEMLLSFSAIAPAGWSADEETESLTSDVTGVTYVNAVTEARSEPHPFLTEASSVVASVRAAVDAKLRQNAEYEELDFLVNRSTTLWRRDVRESASTALNSGTDPSCSPV